MTAPKLPHLLPRASITRREQAFRRFEDLYREIESDLGGHTELSAAQKQLAQRAAISCALAEDMESRWVEGRSIDIPQYATIMNSQLRLFSALGIKRQPRDCTPDLATYLKQVNDEQSVAPAVATARAEQEN
jgi:hypothetical protein